MAETSKDQKSVDDSTQFVDSNRSRVCLKGFKQLLDETTLCDLTLVAEGEEVKCHKALLASSCKYFHAMFTSNFKEKNKDRITMNEIEPAILKAVVHYLYSGEAKITTDNVETLFNAAHMLELGALEDACSNFMERHVTESNCVGMYRFATFYKRQWLKNKAESTICEQFGTAAKGDEFLELSKDDICCILSFTKLKCDSEVDVYEAALRWLTHNWPERKEHIYSVMENVRFAHLDQHVFEWKAQRHAKLKSCKKLQEIFKQVQYYIKHPQRWHEVDLVMEPRLWTNAHFERPVVCAGFTRYSWEQRFKFYDRGLQDHPIAMKPYPEDISSDRIIATAAGNKTLYIASADGRTGGVCWFSDGDFVRVDSMKHPRTDFAFTHVDQCLYAIGGCIQDTPVNIVEKFDIEKKTWSNVKTLPLKTKKPCAVSYQGQLYVFGGEVTSKTGKGGKVKTEASKGAYRFDPEKRRWQRLKPMQEARAYAGCAVAGGKIYVVGGLSKIKNKKKGTEDVVLASTEIYDPVTNTWSKGPDLPKPLYAIGVVKYYGTIFVLEGLANPPPPPSAHKQQLRLLENDVYSLSSDGSQWLLEKGTFSEKCALINDWAERCSYIPANVKGCPRRGDDTDAFPGYGFSDEESEYFDDDDYDDYFNYDSYDSWYDDDEDYEDEEDEEENQTEENDAEDKKSGKKGNDDEWETIDETSDGSSDEEEEDERNKVKEDNDKDRTEDTSTSEEDGDEKDKVEGDEKDKNEDEKEKLDGDENQNTDEEDRNGSDRDEENSEKGVTEDVEYQEEKDKDEEDEDHQEKNDDGQDKNEEVEKEDIEDEENHNEYGDQEEENRDDEEEEENQSEGNQNDGENNQDTDEEDEEENQDANQENGDEEEEEEDHDDNEEDDDSIGQTEDDDENEWDEDAEEDEYD